MARWWARAAIALTLTLGLSAYASAASAPYPEFAPYPAFPDANYARQAVRFERRLELAMEGQRLFDVRRWGIATEVINGYLRGTGASPYGTNGGREDARRSYKTSAEDFAAQHRWYFIPQDQIDLSKVGTEDRLKQNSGW